MTTQPLDPLAPLLHALERSLSGEDDVTLEAVLRDRVLPLAEAAEAVSDTYHLTTYPPISNLRTALAAMKGA